MKRFLLAVVGLAVTVGCTHGNSKMSEEPRKPSNTGDVGSVNTYSQVPEGPSGRSTPLKMDPKNMVCGMDAHAAVLNEVEMKDLGIVGTAYPVTDDTSRGANNLVRWVVYGLSGNGTRQRIMAMVFEQPATLGSKCKLMFKSVSEYKQ